MPDTPPVHETPHGPDHAGHQHEANTVRIGPIVIFGGGLMLLTIVVLLLMGGMFSALSTRAVQSEPPPSPMAETRQPLTQPRLQVNAPQDLQEMRATEDSVLHSYGWVDRGSRVVRIPINRAIELLTERGLPVRTED